MDVLVISYLRVFSGCNQMWNIALSAHKRTAAFPGDLLLKWTQLSAVWHFCKNYCALCCKSSPYPPSFAVVHLILMPLLVVFAFLDHSSGSSSLHTSDAQIEMTKYVCYQPNFSCFSPGDHLSSQPGPPPLPPAPPPHRQHPSITSLSRSSLANQRSPSPPPTAGLAADLQSTAECVQLQDSWVLGSNVALESRWATRGIYLHILYILHQQIMWRGNNLKYGFSPRSDIHHSSDAEIWGKCWWAHTSQKCWSFRI